MKNIEQLSVGEMVAKDYRTAVVFKKYGIDFCCGGDRLLEQACRQSNVASSLVEKELRDVIGHAKQPASATSDYASWPLDLLADHIEKVHHLFVTEQAVNLTAYLNKISSVHGDRHPELFEIQSLFADCTAELAVHMKEEELMLFPFIRKMVQARQTGNRPPSAVFGNVQNPIQQMLKEHATEGERFRQIRKLTGDYSAPVDACTTYRLTYDLLKAFKDDLHLHIHLENNILFPKSVELERELLAKS